MTKIANTQDLDRWIGFVRTQKLPLELSCRKWTKPRTDPQNNYLFGIVYPAIAEVMGYTVDDLHQWTCGNYFGWVDRKVPKTPNNPGGIESVPFRTTTKDQNGKRDVITPEEFANLLDTVVLKAAAQCGAFIPEPYRGDA